jgi:hypothetical protein
MSSNISIECRQANATSIQANGDYETSLSKAITISEGDVVQLSKAFVDTVRESDINIVSDLTLIIKSGVYLTNWYRWNNDIENAVVYDGQPYTDSPDFRKYIPYVNITADVEIYSLFMTAQFFQNRQSGPNIAPIGLTYEYIDFNNNVAHATFYTPTIITGVVKTLLVNMYIVAKIGSVKLISTTYDLAQAGLTFEQYNTNPVDGTLAQPFVFRTEVLVPKGVYSPVQLSTYISQQLSKSGLSSNVENQNMTNSKFLFSTGDFDAGKAYPDGQLNPNGTPKLLPEQTSFISSDGEVLLNFNAGTNFLIGSSQIGLEFDPNSNKFQWTQIHSNMYDATSGTDISVRYLRYNFAETGRVMGVANNGGIYFSSLTAFDASGKYVPFFENVLGMDLSTLCVNTTPSTETLFNIPNTLYNLSNPLIVGSNITDGYYGLDSSIIRGSVIGDPPNYNNPNTWMFRQNVPFYSGTGTYYEAQDGICSTINSTTAIVASQPIDVLLNKFSHFILQTDFGFSNNDYIGSDYYKNINGVISKYFSYGSYCASLESEGAIQYVHKGADIQLKSIRIRLLTSDKKIDVNLGPDNTVIFQLVKSGSGLAPVRKLVL